MPTIEEMRQRVDEGRNPRTGRKVRGLGPGLMPLVNRHPTHKVCTICDVRKPISRFPRHEKMADKHRNECRGCLNLRRRKAEKLRREREARRRKP